MARSSEEPLEGNLGIERASCTIRRGMAKLQVVMAENEGVGLNVQLGH